MEKRVIPELYLVSKSFIHSLDQMKKTKTDSSSERSALFKSELERIQRRITGGLLLQNDSVISVPSDKLTNLEPNNIELIHLSSTTQPIKVRRVMTQMRMEWIINKIIEKLKDKYKLMMKIYAKKRDAQVYERGTLGLQRFIRDELKVKGSVIPFITDTLPSVISNTQYDDIDIDDDEIMDMNDNDDSPRGYPKLNGGSRLLLGLMEEYLNISSITSSLNGDRATLQNPNIIPKNNDI